jgi:hypothetical protein
VICFRDRTYCSRTEHAPDCERQWTPELQAEAERWWGGPDAPVCFGPCCDGTGDRFDDRVRP